VQVYTDSHVSTRYHWARPHALSPESTATITWDIPEDTSSGKAPGFCSFSCTWPAWPSERPATAVNVDALCTAAVAENAAELAARFLWLSSLLLAGGDLCKEAWTGGKSSLLDEVADASKLFAVLLLGRR